jgi:hypothetical protein
MKRLLNANFEGIDYSMPKVSLIFLFVIHLALHLRAQPHYADHSVLSSGNWYQISIKDPGVYRVDANFLTALGIQLPIPSASLRLFGNGGKMLPEANSVARPDDLLENAIQVLDGGDGQFDGKDYFLFYADGPDTWSPDMGNHRFSHQKNLYSEVSYYYISIQGTGLSVQQQINIPISGNPVNSFDERFAHELDTINFLNSGKAWYGEEFSAIPGRPASRSFTIDLPNIDPTYPVTVNSSVIARSIGQVSRFDLRLNDQPLFQQVVAPVSGISNEPIAQPSVLAGSVSLNKPSIVLQYNFTPGSVNGQGWLNWFEVFFRRMLDMSGSGQLAFRDWMSMAPGNAASFTIKGTSSSTQVWDISDNYHPVQMSTTLQGNELHFIQDASTLHEFIAFEPASAYLPKSIGKLASQDLHGSIQTQFIILTTTPLLDAANQIAEHHRKRDNLDVTVTNVSQVYHEFSSGSADPVALRDYVKMYRDRAGKDSSRRPEYLLLLGAATFDPRNKAGQGISGVPSFESTESLDPLSTYVSDDFFALLDDADDVNAISPAGLLDIGVGRIPAKDAAAAKAVASKLDSYTASASMGPWRNQASFTADDEDANLHLQDAEYISGIAASMAPQLNIGKTYLDAFKQESSAGGSRYPAVNSAINSRIYGGTLIWNYNGHGGSRRLAEEDILDRDMVDGWNNAGKLPLFITATCDFAPYDDPSIDALGSNILLRDRTGGIALLTTTRPVYAYSNRIINANYLRIALERQANGGFLTLGESLRRAKNFTYQTAGDVANNRKFTLLGDPALTLALPNLKVLTTHINGRPIGVVPDTIRALDRYTINGLVTDHNGIWQQGFTGTVYPTLLDKEQVVSTLGNDASSPVTSFKVRNSPIYNGKVQAVNGKFSFTFIVPKDISYAFGEGRLSYYAAGSSSDASGYTSNVVIGGLGNGVIDDRTGPQIKAYLNDEKFVNGGLSNESPILIMRLSDSSGINTVGTGIGHSMTAVLDGDSRNSWVLNDYYESETDSYQRGQVRFQLPKLEEGPHTLTMKAWDVFNNSADYILEFRVLRKEKLELRHVLNYPNPFTSSTKFWFEHNRPGEELRVQVQVMTVTGKLVKTIAKTIFTPGNRSEETEWDGRDDYGAKLARGVYIYRIRVATADGQHVEEVGKMYIL